MEGDLYTYLLMAMEVKKVMIVELMAIHQVYTPYLLELLELMGNQVLSMRSAQQKWLLHM